MVTRYNNSAYERQARSYGKGRKVVSFLEGDQVLRVNHVLSSGSNRFSSKLAPKLGPTTYLLDTGSCRKNNKVHVFQLKRFVPRRGNVNVV